MVMSHSSVIRTRRWSRVEYDRLIEKGLFEPGERLELISGALVVREPQGSAHATDTPGAHPQGLGPYGWRYRDVQMLAPSASAAPLAAPASAIAVADLLP